MKATRTLPRRRWGDGLVVLLFAAAMAEIIWHPGWNDAQAAAHLASQSKWLTIPFAFVWTLPLLARRRSGLVAGLTVAGAIAVLGLISNPATDMTVMFIAYLAASGVIGLYEDRVRAVAGGIAAFVLLLVLLSTNPGGIGPGEVFVGMIFAFGPLTAGQVVRELTHRNVVLEQRARELERLQIVQAEAAVAEERARIANELHDVIAHGVSVMTVQASGARLLLRNDPARARAAIEAVENAGREALAETRRLLGILRQDTSAQRAPQPGIDDLEAIFESARAAGLALSLRVEGEPRALSPGLGLAAYRVVSDACGFTQGLGGVPRADVTLRWLQDALEIEVAGDDSAERDSSARLVARVAERIRLYGGTLETGRRDDGAGVFTARLPLEVSP